MQATQTIRSRAARLALMTLFTFAMTMGASAATLSGTVNNKTTGKPSSGDTVAVVNLAKGMDDIGTTTTDSHGKYKLNVPDGGQFLLHATHNGADYFQRVPPGSSGVDLDVYDVATHVDGVAGEAIIVRVETDPVGKSLNMGMNFFINNASNPQRTQFGGNTYDFYLPKGAIIVETLANGPGGMPVTAPITTLDKNSGHYAFTFPIRPGETRFQVSYTLPYTGKQSFAVKPTLPTSDVAVMLPKSMTFQPGASTKYQPINEDTTLQTFDAHNPDITQPVQFSVTGSGQLPEVRDAGQQGGGGQMGGGGDSSQMGGNAAANDTRPGGGLGTPIDTPDPLSKYKWWIIGGLALALVAAAGFLFSGKGADPLVVEAGSPTAAARPTAAAPVAAPLYAHESSLAALKDELFHLETERLHGKITDEQYAVHKGAIEVLMRRVLAREGHLGSMTSSPFASTGKQDPNVPGDTEDPHKT